MLSSRFDLIAERYSVQQKKSGKTFLIKNTHVGSPKILQELQKSYLRSCLRLVFTIKYDMMLLTSEVPRNISSMSDLSWTHLLSPGCDHGSQRWLQMKLHILLNSRCFPNPEPFSDSSMEQVFSRFCVHVIRPEVCLPLAVAALCSCSRPSSSSAVFALKMTCV